MLHKSQEIEDDKKWCLIFPGSDRTVMLRSERFRHEKENRRPAQIQAYVQVLIYTTILDKITPLFHLNFNPTTAKLI